MQIDNKWNKLKEAMVLCFVEKFFQWSTCYSNTCFRNHLMLTLMTIHGSLAARHVGNKMECDLFTTLISNIDALLFVFFFLNYN